MRQLDSRQATATALTADGQLAPTGNLDKTVRIWDTATGQCLHELLGHTDLITSATFSSDGRHALTASLDRTGRLWDIGSGMCLHTFIGPTDEVWSVEWSIDELTALIANSVWDIDWDYEFDEPGPSVQRPNPLRPLGNN